MRPHTGMEQLNQKMANVNPELLSTAEFLFTTDHNNLLNLT